MHHHNLYILFKTREITRWQKRSQAIEETYPSLENFLFCLFYKLFWFKFLSFFFLCRFSFSKKSTAGWLLKKLHNSVRKFLLRIFIYFIYFFNKYPVMVVFFFIKKVLFLLEYWLYYKFNLFLPIKLFL